MRRSAVRKRSGKFFSVPDGAEISLPELVEIHDNDGRVFGETWVGFMHFASAEITKRG